MPRLRLAMAQTNPIVGDLRGNSERLLELATSAYGHGAQVFLTGELALTGYPIEDLALRDNFLASATRHVAEFARLLEVAGMGDLVVVLGHPDGPHPVASDPTAPHQPARAHNAASVLYQGRVQATYAKHHLPNYAVFDEFRTFVPGNHSLIIRVAGADLGIVICEDLWRNSGPVSALTGYPLSALLVPNASPFERDKDLVRAPLVTTRAREMNTTICYVNLVGGQDDLVFDGDSMVITPAGERIATGARFDEDLIVVDLDLTDSVREAAVPPETRRVALEGGRAAPKTALEARPREQLEDLAVIWKALVTGTRDYVTKNGFPGVLLGLSGGIDSAVCAAIAADALGPDRVHGVSMPSVHSSSHSQDDASDLAQRIGLHYRVEPIADLVAPFDHQLGLTGLAAENVQARGRGMLLMALSNSEGHLVLTTGNKSELAVGYSTIYGDAVGGYAPLKDVPKTMVWALARWRNEDAARRGETAPIPTNSIEKPPSAELRPGQTDQDSLPDYEVLDQILDLLIVEGLDEPQIVARGFQKGLVGDIVAMVGRAEWKRRQGALGPRISSVAFGRDRRLPVTQKITGTDRPH
ncbi:MAG: NAD+ synthase [Actinobacteria bacterium]|uniref:NAD(+) synthase (glutamine-hydrolyzing) n=1 Tax=freshwater metagenome TaxID=449393 RepID=A0A6J6JHJ3_9ZZZZ|nr:NAD+ synthase [Actinomycetota bacterium]